MKDEIAGDCKEQKHNKVSHLSILHWFLTNPWPDSLTPAQSLVKASFANALDRRTPDAKARSMPSSGACEHVS
jgi:hypothetical protein